MTPGGGRYGAAMTPPAPRPMAIGGTRSNLTPVGTPTSRTELVADAIRRAILEGDLAGGSPLVERELAERLAVSKTPVREALWSLTMSGLVVATTYRGMAVRPVDLRLVHEVYGVRELLEPPAIRLAVPNHDGDTLELARRSLATAVQAYSADDPTSVNLANREFHQTLYGRCGNQQLVRVLDGLQDIVALIAAEGWRREQTWPIEASEHEQILDAVSRRDRSGAQRLTKRHITNSTRRLTAVFDDSEPQLEDGRGNSPRGSAERTVE